MPGQSRSAWLNTLEVSASPPLYRAGGLTLEWREGGGTVRSSSATQILLLGTGDQDLLTAPARAGGGGLGRRVTGSSSWLADCWEESTVLAWELPGDGVLNITFLLSDSLSGLASPTLFMMAAMATFLWCGLPLAFSVTD